MNQLHIETPLIESRTLTLHTGRRIFLKIDALQPTGSFKIRGIGYTCQEYKRQGARRFISSSGGNAGIAVAYAGRLLSVPVIVVVPETTTAAAQALIRQEGAEIIVHGASWQEANAYAMSLVSKTDAFLHPFDDPLIWRGHATLVDEIVQTGLKPEAIILSVGGGGLLSGIVEGLQRHGWSDLPILAVETEGADSLAQAMGAGHLVELPAITSIATTLGAKQVCAQALHNTQTHPIQPIVVSDQSAVSACLHFLTDHRLLVEPACGASLAPLYEKLPALDPFQSILVIVCGGATATLGQLQQWAKTLP